MENRLVVWLVSPFLPLGLPHYPISLVGGAGTERGRVGGSIKGLARNVWSHLTPCSLGLVDVWADFFSSGLPSQTLVFPFRPLSPKSLFTQRSVLFFIGGKLLALWSDVRAPGCPWMQPTCVPWENTFAQTICTSARDLKAAAFPGSTRNVGGQPLHFPIL